jgi:hypothetical protein
MTPSHLDRLECNVDLVFELGVSFDVERDDDIGVGLVKVVPESEPSAS